MSAAVEAAARALLGVPFRGHGRDPRWGVDCVGLVALALRAGGWRGVVPDLYRLRFGDARRAAAMLDAVLARRGGASVPGDVLLLRTGPGQLHLGIRSRAGMIHADLAAGRAVERPGALAWPLLGAWTAAAG